MYKYILQSMDKESDISSFQLPFSIWANNLKKLGDELQLTIKETEEEFLSIGSSLKDFYNRTENISKMSSHIAHLLSGEEISGSINRLRQLVIRMNDHMEHSRSETEWRIEKLRYLKNSIININYMLEDIGMSIKSLKVLGMTTRIHGNNERNFTGLATDVKKLAADMTSKTSAIQDGLKSLNNKIRETLSKVLTLNDIQQNRAKEILDNTMYSISSLTEKHALSTTLAEDISRLSEETSMSIAEVVKFLQFHDIVYQQINQIKDSFYSLHEKLEIARCEENSDNTAPMKLISETGLFCDFQADQFCQYRDKMISAVNSIIVNLRTINRNVVDISQETRELAGDTGEKEQSFLSETKKGLSIITSAIATLAENANVSNELSKDTSSIVLDEISLFLEDIVLIQDEIELIALNAAVKAANMDKGGEILNVISESIRKLTIEVRSQTDSISHVFRSMTSVTKDLSAGIDYEKERDAQVYDLAAEFEFLTNSFNRINTDIASLLTTIDKEGRKLSEDIDLTIKGIYINDIVSKVCHTAIAEMKEIALVSHSMVTAKDGIDKEKVTLRMMKDQLQGIERKCVLGKTYAGAFSVEQDNERGSHFGDNVELF
jgi:methyl-accepting chemotaxis protein